MLGLHVIADFYNCDSDHILNDIQLLEKYMRTAATQANATIISSTFRRFAPYGVTGVIIIAESHLSIHTWPEYKFAALDFFTCGIKTDPWTAFHYMRQILKPETYEIQEVKRGLLNDPTIFQPLQTNSHSPQIQNS